jgi:hypothetical protein
MRLLPFTKHSKKEHQRTGGLMQAIEAMVDGKQLRGGYEEFSRFARALNER